jgi:TPR repeat protein
MDKEQEKILKSFYWYQKAAEQDHVKAQVMLGYLYEQSEGTEKNFEKAFLLV